jgi:hypothetical protein
MSFMGKQYHKVVVPNWCIPKMIEQESLSEGFVRANRLEAGEAGP